VTPPRIGIEVREAAGRTGAEDQHAHQHLALQAEQDGEGPGKRRQQYKLGDAGHADQRREPCDPAEVVDDKLRADRDHEQKERHEGNDLERVHSASLFW
jgi:hypothetical protein